MCIMASSTTPIILDGLEINWLIEGRASWQTRVSLSESNEFGDRRKIFITINEVFEQQEELNNGQMENVPLHSYYGL